MDLDAFDAIGSEAKEVEEETPNTATANIEAEITTHIILREQYIARLSKALKRATPAQLQKRLLKALEQRLVATRR